MLYKNVNESFKHMNTMSISVLLLLLQLVLTQVKLCQRSRGLVNSELKIVLVLISLPQRHQAASHQDNGCDGSLQVQTEIATTYLP